MGGNSKFRRIGRRANTLLLALAAASCAQGKNKSYDDEGGTQSGGTVSGAGGGGQVGQQMVTIPVELNYKAKSFALANATTFDISLESCATGYTSTADENSTALQVYKFDRGCKAKLTGFTFGGRTYIPTVADPFASWNAGDIATFDEVGLPGTNAVTVKVVSQLADPVAGNEAVVYSFSELVKGADEAIMEAVLGDAHSMTVASQPPPSYTIEQVQFVGINAQGGGQFVFTLDCTAAMAGDVCEQVDQADITYKLVEDSYASTMDIGEANALFPAGETAITLPGDQEPAAGLTPHGGFHTITLDGPDQMALHPNMIFIMQAADTSYQYFNVDVSTLTQD